MKKVRMFGFAALAALWLALVLGAWFAPVQDISESERRKLAQMPEVTVDSILSGKFMTDFEKFTLDQFPLRDSFRTLKALVHYNVLQQGDNNNIYVADGYAAKLEYPLNQPSVDSALEKFNHIYDSYLTGTDCKTFVTIAPDKGMYLAQANGYPAMDYQALFTAVEKGMDWAQFVDISGSLDVTDYYRTDTHWRQEQLLEAARRLCEAMETGCFDAAELTQMTVEKPFYGVYYGQAALLEITNPEGSSDRELVVFRDSFGSSMIPLLVKDYGKVTMVDTRYVSPELLGQYLEFDNQDVLFLYSTLILNSSGSLK